jgi:hypothetical protein
LSALFVDMRKMQLLRILLVSVTQDRQKSVMSSSHMADFMTKPIIM